MTISNDICVIFISLILCMLVSLILQLLFMAYTLVIVRAFWHTFPLIIMKCYLLSLVIFLTLKHIFFDIERAI